MVDGGAELGLDTGRLILGDDGSGEMGGVGMYGELLRLDLASVLTVNSSGFIATLMGRGRCRMLDLPSSLRVDRGGRLGGDEPLVKRDSGRKVDGAERASMLATVIIGDMVKVRSVGDGGRPTSSGGVSSTMIDEKVHWVGVGAVGVTGVVVSSTVSGIYCAISAADGLGGRWSDVSSSAFVGVAGAGDLLARGDEPRDALREACGALVEM